MDDMKREKIKRRIPVAATIAAIIFAFLAILGPTANAQGVSDQDVTLAVEDELMESEAVPAHLIDVMTVNGVVTLSGSVDNLLAKNHATRVAETIKGVKAVVNTIDVKPIKRPDVDIEKDVEDALFFDPATEAFEIQADVNDAHVTLTGAVESWQEKQLAAEIVRGVKGVKGVENDIIVDPVVKRSDAEIEPEIERRLELDPWVDDGLIEVNVTNGKVNLTGVVGSAHERRMARADAWVGGVRSVNTDSLRVEWWSRDDMQREQKYALKSDDEIREAIETAFFFDPRVIPFDPEIHVDDGVVTLLGVVDNLKAKKAAGQDARNTIGVWQVKNHLRVRPETIPGNEELESRVIDALARDPYVEVFDISVTAANGKVILFGKVNTSFEKRHAEELTWRIRGVVEVENRLDYEYKWEYKSDWAIERDVENQIYWSPFVDSDEVTVNVSDGVVTLTGEVDTWREWLDAEENAYEGGAKDVINKLDVEYQFFRPQTLTAPPTLGSIP